MTTSITQMGNIFPGNLLVLFQGSRLLDIERKGMNVIRMHVQSISHALGRVILCFAVNYSSGSLQMAIVFQIIVQQAH